MVLGVDREVVLPGVSRDALRHRPGREHAVALQAKIPVQRSGPMLLDDESTPVIRKAGSVGGGFARPPDRFRGRPEVALGLVLGERIRRFGWSGAARRHCVTLSRPGDAPLRRGGRGADAASGAIG
jgi:hypothetical protein